MRTRKMGRLGFEVSEVGYGMWGIAGGSDTLNYGEADASTECLDRAIELGCNFFDTAWIYGEGVSERMLGDLLARHRDKQLYVATKLPPKSMKWPPLPGTTLQDAFPADHIRDYTQRSLENLGLDCIDLMQFHVWEDDWASDESWQRAMSDMRAEGLIKGIGISVNRWEPANCLRAIDTGMIDVIQVIYNIFDQAPEDDLFKVALEKDIGIIARVPFDEGGLTGMLSADTAFPSDDWRSVYFGEENLLPTVKRADALKPLVPEGSSLAEMALKFILHHPAVSAVIPGMRKLRHVEANMAVGSAPGLDATLIDALRAHRWDRVPTAWSR